MDTKALRQKILDLAIHGKLVPQDPNDEPASVLLERIRAEKERLIKEGKIKKGKKSAKTSDKPHYPFELPKGWKWCRLEDYVFSVTDGDHQAPPKVSKGIPFLVISNIADGSLDFSNTRYVPEEYYEKIQMERKPKRGDILFSVTGSYGIVVNIKTDRLFCFQRHIGLIKPTISNEYLSFVLMSNYIKSLCDKLATGTAQKTVGLDTLRSLYVPIAPIEEQERIVAKIKHLLLQISFLEAGKGKLVAAIKQAKSKILDLAIHGKLVPQDPNDEPASELLKRINPKAEITCDNPQYGKLPFVIPSSWEWVKLSGIAKSNIGLTYRPTDIVSTGVPVYRSNNIRNGKIDTTDLVKVSTKILEKQLLHVGDLLICARNGSRNLIGKNAIISELKEPTSFGAFMAVCRSAYNQWIRIVLNSEYFDRYLDDSNSATINQVTQKMLLALPIPLPPHQEQHRIVAKIEELFAQLDKIEASL
ncbi:restriction endonuclease subunit S [Prevotella sp. AM23-5]|jgi:type I restriction enzyme, S subunit|uniref:Restriction endonuclease subunit S n=3 Tax=Pseudomonadati TaxID=3379134 RepID=A0AAW5IEQ1_9BACT|nr:MULTISPECIES: restriction endonuclease subunit S [Prevotellaceae]MCP9533433.1 restriction endonuclease subunit S [Segatella copri]MCP9560429.1 restriction endonuclease subunit S [Segatella copri]MCP9563293.1 restriction endonuclease subunit S [Segatella copri]MCP9566187.1 restriction endonuclease subunit S [Segatella copri]RHN93153.1 restriction endonuclease subunit S [Prevotella sp. AM23-5]